jgi:DNA-directed RNA polymerase sigma subunit (sigma70/sigma32)
VNRWRQLNQREQHIVRLFIVENKKLDAIASEIGISATRITQIMVTVYRLLEVPDQVQLALWVGRNWDLVNAKDVTEISRRTA